MDTVESTAYWIQAARYPQADLDQVAAQNYSLPMDIHRTVRTLQVSFLQRILEEQPGPRHVLDLGCGPGVWAIQLSHLVDSWLGVDIAPNFVEHAQREAAQRGLAHLEFRVSSMLEVSEGRRFNVVVLGGTLGYMSDRDLVPIMEKVREHLLPGGVVYVRVSTMPGIYPRLALRGRYPITYRKQAEYEQMFRQVGFDVESHRDYAFTDASLATAYTAPARWYGRTGMTAYRMALKLRPLTFGLARRLLDLTPLPHSSLFVLRHSSSST